MPVDSFEPSSLHPDFTAWLPVVHPSAQNPVYLSALPSGHLTLNERLIKEMSASPLAFRFLLQPDGKALALFPQEGGSYRFPKGGRIRDQAFTRRLVSLNIPLPARYRIAWNESCGAWIGVLEEDNSKRALEASLIRGHRRKERSA